MQLWLLLFINTLALVIHFTYQCNRDIYAPANWPPYLFSTKNISHMVTDCATLTLIIHKIIDCFTSFSAMLSLWKNLVSESVRLVYGNTINSRINPTHECNASACAIDLSSGRNRLPTERNASNKFNVIRVTGCKEQNVPMFIQRWTRLLTSPWAVTPAAANLFKFYAHVQRHKYNFQKQMMQSTKCWGCSPNLRPRTSTLKVCTWP